MDLELDQLNSGFGYSNDEEKLSYHALAGHFRPIYVFFEHLEHCLMCFIKTI